MHLRQKREFTVLCSNILVWEWKKGGSINSKSWIFWRIEFTNWKLVATWLAHSKHFLALKVQLKGFESAHIKGTSGREIFNFRENTVPRSFYQISSKKRQHLPHLLLVDNFQMNFEIYSFSIFDIKKNEKVIIWTNLVFFEIRKYTRNMIFGIFQYALNREYFRIIHENI